MVKLHKKSTQENIGFGSIKNLGSKRIFGEKFVYACPPLQHCGQVHLLS